MRLFHIPNLLKMEEVQEILGGSEVSIDDFLSIDGIDEEIDKCTSAGDFLALLESKR
jgi:hypothetical protein